jgi:hypothetical protein
MGAAGFELFSTSDIRCCIGYVGEYIKLHESTSASSFLSVRYIITGAHETCRCSSQILQHTLLSGVLSGETPNMFGPAAS